ncbi:lysozyme inhibitor LprI family protein [Acinetobacter sichuanensis]|uniref:DUF1311 domain-containing protein n=1 Tax=Acinetobacter sichuanensis TaxID=2136183 RepID=A0A371YKJ8_9GAMM|nr:lysozyme inhibitor LprI family protein [Acinetobacter sichuanensis]RFC81854.1 DUF1311 domain-containing protein [Acinetobacter sichuanensis]
MSKLLLLIVISAFSGGVWATECELIQKTPSGVAECYEKQSLANVLLKLNKLKSISKDQISYNPHVIQELEYSQKTWLAYRDSYCTAYSNYHNEMNNHSNCIISLNNQRAEQLQNDIDAN